MAAEQSQKASQDKSSHKHQVPFLNNLDKDGQLSQSWFYFIFTSVWILIAVAWNTSSLIPGDMMCLVKNGDDNFPGNG